MCGFVVTAGEGAAAPGVVEAGLDAIRHRGPDGQGVWRSPDGRAALGHARLAIIDLSPGGAQPMRSADGRAVVAYNGEIYNYKELAPQVPVPLRSTSDTEVLVELLRSEGAAAVQRLRGMFAFAYWNGDEMLLVRDRLGISLSFTARRTPASPRPPSSARSWRWAFPPPASMFARSTTTSRICTSLLRGQASPAAGSCPRGTCSAGDRAEEW